MTKKKNDLQNRIFFGSDGEILEFQAVTMLLLIIKEGVCGSVPFNFLPICFPKPVVVIG